MKKYEKAEEKRKREAEEKRRYLEGIKRFQKVGVTVLVQDLEKIVEIREDGAFYMGDYIADESGRLVEIRFDKVYHR